MQYHDLRRTHARTIEMAGNIIPAIATTNAIIAGLIVLQALHLLRRAFHALRNVHAQFKPSMPLSAIFTSGPNPGCGVCRDVYVEARCDVRVVTLGQLVEGVLGGETEGEGEGEDGGTGRREVSVYEGQRVLSDPDWEDNWERTLESLGVTRGKFLAIMDEEGELATIQVAISPLYVCFALYISSFFPAHRVSDSLAFLCLASLDPASDRATRPTSSSSPRPSPRRGANSSRRLRPPRRPPRPRASAPRRTISRSSPGRPRSAPRRTGLLPPARPRRLTPVRRSVWRRTGWCCWRMRTRWSCLTR